MKIILATDHAGFEMKEAIKERLLDQKIEVEDVGAHTLDESDDYPVYISKAAEIVSKASLSMGIIFGGSGQGEAIVANRFVGVRAAVYNTPNTELITLSREHNNANVLSIGARFISTEQAYEAVQLFLSTSFSNEERHIRRIRQIDGL